MATDAEAREAGFLSAADMEHYTREMQAEEDTYDWIDAGAPSPLEMWRQLQGVERVDTVPLTVEQAARRKNVSTKTIRRKLPALEALAPRGAYRTSDSPRAPWRIIPAALDRVWDQSVEPKPAVPSRGRKVEPRRRSATRWEA